MSRGENKNEHQWTKDIRGLFFWLIILFPSIESEQRAAKSLMDGPIRFTFGCERASYINQIVREVFKS